MELTHDVEGIKTRGCYYVFSWYCLVVGGQHGFVLGGLLFFVGIELSFVEFLSLQLLRTLIKNNKSTLF